jgi:hypothetical protein
MDRAHEIAREIYVKYGNEPKDLVIACATVVAAALARRAVNLTDAQNGMDAFSRMLGATLENLMQLEH